jgi:hypothetical protein
MRKILKEKDNLPTLWVQANTESRILSLEAVQSFWKLYAIDRENQLSCTIYNFSSWDSRVGMYTKEITHLPSRIFWDWLHS